MFDAFLLTAFGATGTAGEGASGGARGQKRKRSGPGGAGRRKKKAPTSAETCPTPTISEPSTPTNSQEVQGGGGLGWDLPHPLPPGFRLDAMPGEESRHSLTEYMKKVRVLQFSEVEGHSKVRKSGEQLMILLSARVSYLMC